MSIELILWFGFGVAILYLAFLCSKYEKVEPLIMVMSDKMIDIYRKKKKFSDKQIIGAVKAQGAVLFIIGGSLVVVGIVRYLMMKNLI